jgi:hypothetical protein
MDTQTGVQQVKKTFVRKGESNHWVVIDSSAKFEGAEAGTETMEHFLIGHLLDYTVCKRKDYKIQLW